MGSAPAAEALIGLTSCLIVKSKQPLVHHWTGTDWAFCDDGHPYRAVNTCHCCARLVTADTCALALEEALKLAAGGSVVAYPQHKVATIVKPLRKIVPMSTVDDDASPNLQATHATVSPDAHVVIAASSERDISRLAHTSTQSTGEK